jgi:hypothetical protein
MKVDRPARRSSARAAVRVQQQAVPVPERVAGELADGRSEAMADERYESGGMSAAVPTDALKDAGQQPRSPRAGPR